MIEIIVVIALTLLLAYEKWEHKRTIEKLTNALIAKNAQELKDLNVVDKLKINVHPTQPTEDLTALSDLSDKEFEDKILGGDNG